ncbi:MAG: hypothetical protein JW889_13600 [Verrucomicrobia bacterium]|nr:hypothetical protein [Verrucomicrobiota bacterium]
MRLGFAQAHLGTTCNTIRAIAILCCVVGSACVFDTSNSTNGDGEPADEEAVGTSGAAGQANVEAANAGAADRGETADEDKKAEEPETDHVGGAPSNGVGDDAGDDTPAGGAGEDTSSGGAGEDTSSGGAGEETSSGGAGADISSGGVGADISSGGVGADISSGGAGEDISSGGAGDEPSDPEELVESTLCQLTDGETVPYDYTFGLVQEYAFELSMDCEVGGHLMPLVMEDPDELSAVIAFESELVDWYRAQVLECAEETSSWSTDQFGLLPPNDAGVSRGDVAAAIGVFMMVLDRHDGSDDGMTTEQKSVVRDRLEAIGTAAAVDSEEVTMPLDAPECAPEEAG